jgi:hypothetical protein
MFILDLETHLIHDASRPAYECHMEKIPKERRKKIFTVDALKRLMLEHVKPPYNGCPYCLSEYHQFDLQSIFYK